MSNQRAQKTTEAVPAGTDEAKPVDAPLAEETEAPKKAAKAKRVSKKAEQEGGEPTSAEVESEKPKRARRSTKEPKESSDVKETKETKGTRTRKAAAASQEGGAQEGKEGKDGKKERTFTVIQVLKDGVEAEFKGGRFASPSPSSAARKGARHACKAYGEDKVEIDIKMQETTKDSGQKEYNYHAVREPRDKKDVSFKTATGVPVQVPFKYQMNLHAIKPPKATKPTEVAA
jgi:hypothetical protein